MNNAQIYITVAVLAVSVMITRFLPFIIFKDTGHLPPVIEYLGKVLPAALMGLLVVYCFKDYDFSDIGNILPALLASAAVVGAHLWKRNTILSISAGTVVYMILIRLL